MSFKTKNLSIDGLSHEVYTRQAHVFIPLLALIFKQGIKDGNITERFTRDMIMLLRKNKHGADEINNFRPLTMLKILANILYNRLQVVLPSLIGPEQICAVRSRIIQNNLHLEHRS